MKTIKDAVIELDGKWPEQAKDSKWFVILTKKLDGSHSELKLKRSEFESTAKRMGYINGYKYMEECTEKGKPNLPDDVMVSVLTHNRGRLPAGHVGFWNWDSSEIRSFRIVDQRHKPVDEVSEISESINKAEYVSEISKSKDFDMKVSETEQSNSWHYRGLLPFSGTKVELWIGGQYKEDVEFLCRRKFDLVFWRFTNDSVDSAPTPTAEVKPIRTHREKVIEAAISIASGGLTKEMYSALYDAGMLVLPQDSSDTKD